MPCSIPTPRPRRPARRKKCWVCLTLVAASGAIIRGSGNAGVVAIASPGNSRPATATGRRDSLPLCFYGARSKSRREVRRVRLPALRYSQYEGTAGTRTKDYFISAAQFVHLGPAARILTEEFYSAKTNFLTFQIERIKTVLSLESTFPNRKQYLRDGDESSRPPLQHMMVACDATNGKVVGFAEVDARPLVGKKSGETAAVVGDGVAEDILRSYMYNLAVDRRWKRRGVASALVTACEDFVSDAHDACLEKRLYLRVRKCNLAAIALYEKMGYTEMKPEVISLNKEDINYGSLEDGELVLFAKDLPINTECMLD